MSAKPRRIKKDNHQPASQIKSNFLLWLALFISDYFDPAENMLLEREYIPSFWTCHLQSDHTCTAIEQSMKGEIDRHQFSNLCLLKCSFVAISECCKALYKLLSLLLSFQSTLEGGCIALLPLCLLIYFLQTFLGDLP